MNIEKEFQYDAFISYRHIYPDNVIAKKLHSLLETYRTPGYLVRKGLNRRINRVFRDREELPTSGNLGDNLLNALESSRFLIVVCSTQTLQSQWINKEIEEFKKTHGADNILALLIDGEPEISFPEPLYSRTIVTVANDGNIIENTIPYEPLAADIRASGIKKSLKLLRIEKLRLIAPLLGCSFDDLRQRHKQRIKRRIAGILAFLCLLSAAGVYQWQNYQMQKNKAILNNSLYLSDLSIKQTSEGDALKGIKTALQALTGGISGGERVYVAQAEAAMYQALGGYHKSFKLDGPKGTLTSICFSNDGTLAAVTSEDYTTTVWDLQTRSQLTVMRKGHNNSVVYADFSSKKDKLVTTSKDGTAIVWDVSTGNKLSKITWNNGYAVFAADDKEIVKADEYDKVESLIVKNSDSFLDTFYKFDISVNTNRIAAITKSRNLEFYELSSRKKIKTIDDTTYYWHVKFSPDGRYVAASTNENEVRIIDAKSCTQYFIAAKSDNLVSFSFSPDSSRIAVGVGSSDSFKNQVVIIDLETQKPFKSVKSFAEDNDLTPIDAWYYNDDGLVVYTKTGALEKENLSSGKLQLVSEPLNVKLEGEKFLDIDSSGKKLINADYHGNMFVYDAYRGKLLKRLEGHFRAVTYAKFSTDGKYVASCSFDNTVRIWDALTYKELKTFKGYLNAPNYVEFSNDDKLIVTGSQDGTAIIWDSETGTQIKKIQCNGVVACARFSIDGRFLLLTTSGIESEKCKISIWDLKKNAMIQEIGGFMQGQNCAAFSSDSKRFITADYQGTISVWDTESGIMLFNIKGIGVAKNIQLNKTGNKLLVVYENGGVQEYKLFDNVSSLINYSDNLIK